MQRLFGIANAVCAFQAGLYVPLDHRTLPDLEGPQREELGELADMPVHARGPRCEGFAEAA